MFKIVDIYILNGQNFLDQLCTLSLQSIRYLHICTTFRFRAVAWDPSLYYYAVNLAGVNLGCIDFYAVLEWANAVWNCIFFATKHKANTYHEHLMESDDCVRILSWPPLKFMTSRKTQEYVESVWLASSRLMRYHWWLKDVFLTPGCGIQESQGLQLAQIKFELNNSSQCTIIPNLFPR